VHDKIVRRRRAVLGLLVALSLVLLSAFFGESSAGILGSIQSGFLDVFSPIQEGVTTLLTPVHDLISSIDDVVHASSQRDEYRRENRALIAQNAGLQAYRRDYLQLAALFKLDQEADVSSYDQVTAQVISESPSVWYSHVMIDVGSSAGVRLGNTVVDGDGLVGQVTTVAHNASEVTLITDSTSAVAARDAASGVWGIAEPAVGTSNELLLAFPSSQQVAPGDLIVTAGTTANGRSEYPPDIPIGHVTNVAAANGAISVEPNANVKQLELVQVLTAPRRHSSAPPGAGGLVPVS
jgi:rod shape-determining protein MreC